jgi:hypothetical protein
MRNLVCLLEEPSAKEMLMGVLPRILPKAIQCIYIVFEGKQDLEKQLVRKLKLWLAPNSAFLIMQDQDAADCNKVKANLKKLCCEASKPDTLVRIACHELESYYFGDLNAVEKGLCLRNITMFHNKARYRIPDNIINPSLELKKITDGRYQKVIGSRNIAPHLSLENNTSHSFNVLISGIKNLFLPDGNKDPTP